MPSTDDLIRSAYTEVLASLGNDGWYDHPLSGNSNRNDSGISVTYDRSLTYSSVFSAVSQISGDIATTPLNVLDIDEQGNQEVVHTSPAQWLLNFDASDQMGAISLRETLTQYALLEGNGYAAIVRDVNGTPRSLIPIIPDEVTVWLAEGQIIYEVRKRTLNDPRVRDQTAYDAGDDHPIWIRSTDMLHLRGFGNGYVGHSVVWLARNSFGYGLGAERHGNRHVKNAARPSIVLKTASKLSAKDAETLLANWQERHGNDSMLPALLTGGLEIVPYSMSNVDSEWLESRKFQRVEVASWFNMPPHKLGDSSKIAFNSIEAENRSYLTQCLARWLSKWEEETSRKLLPDRDRRSRRRCIKHDLKELIKPDLASQVDNVVKLRAAEIINANEGRNWLGMNARTDPGGSLYNNPNTTPGNSPPEGGETSTIVDTLSPENTSNEPQIRLLGSILGRMAKVTRSAVSRAVGKRDDFLSWLNDFFQTLPPKFRDDLETALEVIQPAACVDEVITQFIEVVLFDLREAAGFSSPDELADNCKTIVVAWEAKAGEFAERVIKGSICVQNQHAVA